MYCKLKFISAAKCYQTVYQFKKADLTIRNQGHPILLLEEIKVKVKKVLRVKCVPFTGIVR